MISRRYPISPLLLAMALMVSADAWLGATRVRLLNLVQMVELSDRIFLGICRGVEEKVDGTTGLPVTEYTFEVRRGLKGSQEGQLIAFRQVQAAGRGALSVPGLPTYEKGTELLLFLHGESRIGLTSPVGMSQGLFRLLETETGEEGVVNSLENANLGYDLDLEKGRSAGLLKADLDLLARKRPIALDTFALLVDKIERNSRLSKR